MRNAFCDDFHSWGQRFLHIWSWLSLICHLLKNNELYITSIIHWALPSITWTRTDYCIQSQPWVLQIIWFIIKSKANKTILLPIIYNNSVIQLKMHFLDKREDQKGRIPLDEALPGSEISCQNHSMQSRTPKINIMLTLHSLHWTNGGSRGSNPALSPHSVWL